jgi:type VI secretion system secreted protein Hcp
MKIKLLAILIMALAATTFSTRAAQVDYFLKIDGIEGESTDAAHAAEIDVLSWAWGMSNSGNPAPGGGGGAGKVNFHDLSITKTIDKATPKLMQACATGKHIKEVILTAARSRDGKSGGKSQDYFVITMSDVVISSCSVGSSGDSLPMEAVSFNFAKVKVEYFRQGPRGGSQPEPPFEFDRRSGE